MKPQTKTSEEPLAWEEMVVVEPRLARLLSDIQARPGWPHEVLRQLPLGHQSKSPGLSGWLGFRPEARTPA